MSWRRFDEWRQATSTIGKLRQPTRICPSRVGGVPHGAGINVIEPTAGPEVESQIGIPSSFELVINVEHSNHHCHVVWRKARRIGVAFD
jgi:hypothetical protein